MRRLLAIALLAAFCFAPFVASAEDLDAETMKALNETQGILTNPALRNQQPGANNPLLQQQLGALHGTAQDQEEVFRIASEVLGDLAKQANGDPDKMQKILDEAMRNPAGFAGKLSPKQQAEIRELAKKLPQPAANTKVP